MTLVVARQINKEVYIVGDTKFAPHAYKDLSQSSQYIGGLKVVILAPGLCVGYAGNTEIARNALQGVYDQEVNLFDKNAAIEHFLKHHVESVRRGTDLETDFIVVVIVELNEQPGEFQKEIFRIANSKVHWENEASHIGDSGAFGYFQEVFVDGRKERDTPIFEISRLGTGAHPEFHQSLSAAMNAMQATIDSPGVGSVDGIRTVVISEGNQFRYVESIQVRGTPIPVRNELGSPVSFGGAEEGSDHKHIGMFSALGHGVFPVYWYTGRFGVIYCSEQSIEPTIFRDCSLDDFRLKVQEQVSGAHRTALACQARHED